MIQTYLLFFSILSMLSKSENDNLEGKSSHLPYFFSGANRGGASTRKSNLLPSSQAALARVQNVRSRHGIRQNLPETCTFLMVPCWVWYDHYRGRYRQLKKVSIYRADPVYRQQLDRHIDGQISRQIDRQIDRYIYIQRERESKNERKNEIKKERTTERTKERKKERSN